MPAHYETFVDWNTLLDLGLLALMIIVAFAMVRQKQLFSVVMLSGVYSLLSALFFVSLDAVDVAFTEAAVGAGMSTVLMLGGMLLTTRTEKKVPAERKPIAFAIVVAVGAALTYATFDMPSYGDPTSPANSSVGQHYVEQMPHEIAMPNIVTGILASYRGYDTLGEVMVVFTAGVGVFLLLAPVARRRRKKDASSEESA